MQKCWFLVSYEYKLKVYVLRCLVVGNTLYIQTALVVNVNTLNSQSIKLLDYSAGIRKVIEKNRTKYQSSRIPVV